MAATPLPGFPTRVATRLGRRGTVLVCVGTIWCLLGWSVLTVVVERFSRPGPSPLDFLDSPQWGWMWVAAGAVAIRLRASLLVVMVVAAAAAALVRLV